ncbi:unnamed protein product [Rotaria magnacalcarata]|uniref:Ubiquitin carboxyl-terminal hydrolase n=1 Tax=Rotaria magnacalcarata TaxID=392030 RepID=A0A816R967_9BILA|nr:unnamed protein product [Rotaria magnacalcarata]CAF3819083.1 unnamed protein product [Rotaria magnacalcarata]
MISGQSESIANRCRLYQSGNPCFIDKNLDSSGYRACFIKAYLPDLYRKIIHLGNQDNFTDQDVIVCKKHFKEQWALYSSAQRIRSPSAYDHLYRGPSCRCSPSPTVSKSVEIKSPRSDDCISGKYRSSWNVQVKKQNEEGTVVIFNKLEPHDYKSITVNKYSETISDLKQRILELWSLNNVTKEQLEIYVQYNVSHKQESLKDKPAETRLAIIWLESALTIYFLLKKKQNPSEASDGTSKPKTTNEKSEKSQTATKEFSYDHNKNKPNPTPRTTVDLDKIPSGLCGLENIGNTCFINSALQCLSNIPPFSHFFEHKEIYKFINCKNPAGTAGRVALTYSSLVQEMWSGKIEKCTPTALKKTIDRYTTQFTGYDQHDSQEFMGFLLDALHEDLLEAQNESSPISRLFQGQLETTIHCENDCPPVLTSSTFNFLPLPISSREDETHLSECIKNFLEVEPIGRHGKWQCDSCHQKTNAWKSTRIKLLPPILILQLKRFVTFTSQRSNNKKINAFVDYPIKNLNPHDLAPDLTSTFTYDLVAISIHRGTLSSGHYTTLATNRHNNFWYNFDDTIVTLASEDEIRTRYAYILCYVRRDMHELPMKDQ